MLYMNLTFDSAQIEGENGKYVKNMNVFYSTFLTYL